jgi:hypothetical protein
MPGSNLTRIEAEERKAVIEAPIHYHVDLDLTVGAKNFGSKSFICFNAKPGSSTFLDLIADEVTSIDLNGKSLDPAVAFQDNRIELTDLKEKNEVTVEARCRYSNTGEGLHRSVDPSDGNIYLYSQFEVPDARRVYAVFDQPDLKATFDFKVLAPASWIVTSNMPVATIEDDPRETLDGTLERKHPSVGLRADPGDELLPDRHLRRPVRRMAHRIPERRRPYRANGPVLPTVVGQGLREGRRLPVRHHQEGLRVLRQDLGRALPVRQVRPDLRARIQRGRDGEHRHGHHPRLLRVRIQGDRRAGRASCGDRAARACAHVVRRLCDHEVVERPVAQRVLR